MPHPAPVLPLPPMPLWLRVLGVSVCLTPLIAGLLSLALGVKDAQEFIGSLVYFLVIFFLVILFLIVPLLVLPIYWGLGWRPGALGGSAFLIVAGVGFLFGDSASDRQLGGLLLLHLPLLGVLAWERRAAIRRRQAAFEATGQAS